MIEQGEVVATNTQKWSKVCGPWSFGPGQSQRVPLAFISQFGADPDFTIDFSPLAQQFRTHSDDGRVAMDFWCPLSMVDGYGRHALAIYQGLLAIGVDVTLRSSWIVSADPWVSSEVKYAAKRSVNTMPCKVGVSMTLPYDPVLYDHGSLVKIALTQFETDHMPRAHVDNINRCQHLIVTSSFQPAVMRRSGVKVPISVMRAGIDNEYFRYIPRSRDGKFKVLILGALTGRKNPLGAIRIFQEASGGSPDWRLTIKSRLADGIGLVQQVARRDSRITVLVRDDPPNAVHAFYARNDVLLWPSKGEGCGLPPLEAMSTGMEVVCSDNSGMSDYIDDRHSWPIRTAKMERANLPGGFDRDYIAKFGDVGSWWVPDEKHAVTQLRRCFEAWYAGKGKGKLAAQYVAENHTLRHQAQSVLEVVQGYV